MTKQQTAALPICTSPVAPRLNEEQLREAIASNFLPIDVMSFSRDAPHDGQLIAATVGSMNIGDICGRDLHFRRTPATIRRGDTGGVKVCVQLRGRGVVVQGNREAELNPGDFSLYDSSEPYSMHYADTFGSLVLMFPRESLKITSDHLARVSAVRIPGDHGVGATVSRLLLSMREVFRAGELSATSMFEDAVLDLVCAAATQNTESGIAPPQSVVVAGAKSFIEARLAEPTLNTTEIAAAQHISVRYLQKLFAADGLTVAGWIRSRRLERSRRDLQDARLVREDISTIGARHGLVNSAHFSRVFKEAYGVSPRAFREQFHSELMFSPGPVGRTGRVQPVLTR